MRKIIRIIACVSLLACSNEEDESFENFLSGYYEMVALKSDSSLDLNNDGVKSGDIFFEIASPHKAVTGEAFSFFDFSARSNFIEIRPLKYSTNNGKLISFNFPEQHIDYLFDGTPYLTAYERSFTRYSYKISKSSDFIQLINGNPGYPENGKLNAFKSLGMGY